MIDCTMPNNIAPIKYALKSFPGLADVGDPHGDKDGSRTQAPGSGSKIHAYHVDQGEKLKGLDAYKVALRPNWLWVEGTDVLFYLDPLDGVLEQPRPHGGPQHQQGQELILVHIPFNNNC